MTVQCDDCGQHWHVELAPEQSPIVAFGLKLTRAAPPTPSELRSGLPPDLAHLGFSADRCRKAGCESRALRGRASVTCTGAFL
jgi:hypothetical protein